MTAIIELNNLSVQFHQKGRLVTAVKDATLHIEKGDQLWSEPLISFKNRPKVKL